MEAKKAAKEAAKEAARPTTEQKTLLALIAILDQEEKGEAPIERPRNNCIIVGDSDLLSDRLAVGGNTWRNLLRKLRFDRKRSIVHHFNVRMETSENLNSISF